MSANEGEDEEIIETENDKEKVKLVSSASTDLRNDVLKLLANDTDEIWKVMNFLIVLTGVYVTLSIFLWNRQKDGNLPILWPEILSVIFLLIALILSIMEIFPTQKTPYILPREIYRMYFEDYEESIGKLTATHLTYSNDVIITILKRKFKRQQIILFIAISLINFSLFGIYFLFNRYEIYLNILAIVFTVDFIMVYFYFIEKGKLKIKEEEYELKNKKTKQKQ